ncbi:hypothetical protein [Fusibacter sp. JL216-2]|uniref:hypothetical protein n=1 Tax=Fusibacter sp. JL216-2 TaxID=3071453 RepID=UPI003D3253CF
MKRKIIMFLSLIMILSPINSPSFSSEINEGTITPSNISISPADVLVKPKSSNNIIGSEGQYEIDSNQDGLPDGWYKSKMATSELIKNNSNSYQKLCVAPSYAGTSFYVGNTLNYSQNMSLEENSFYAILSDVKIVSSNNLDYFLLNIHGATQYGKFVESRKNIYADLNKIGVWQSVGVAFKTNGNRDAISFIHYGKTNGTVTESTSPEIHIDNTRLVRITEDDYNNLSIPNIASKYRMLSKTATLESIVVNSTGKNLVSSDDWTLGALTWANGADNNGYDDRYRSDYIPVNSDLDYYASGFKNSNIAYLEYDSNLDYLGYKYTGGKILLSSSTKYIRIIIFNSKDEGIDEKFQLEAGNTATPYESYEESVMYVPASELGGLNALENGATDIITDSTQVKQVEKLVISDNSLWTLYDNDYSNNSLVAFELDLTNFNSIVDNSNDLVELFWRNSKFYRVDSLTNLTRSNQFALLNGKLIILQDSFSDSDTFTSSLEDSPIHVLIQYQEPIKNDYNGSGLLVYPNGQITYEFIKKSTGVYSNGLYIDDHDQLRYLKSVSKLSGGVKTRIDKSKCKVDLNGVLSVSEAQNGEIYEVEFYYAPENSGWPVIEIDYNLDDNSHMMKNTKSIENLTKQIQILSEELKHLKEGNIGQDSIQMKYDDNGNLILIE